MRKLTSDITFEHFLRSDHQIKSIPSHIELCKARDEGFVCTLATGHLGKHEAYDFGGICQHTWEPRGYPKC
jgi:hypothetical protein